MPDQKTVLITAGGTGGHVFPGLALAEELKKRSYNVHWLGTEAGIESRIVADRDIPLHLIGVKGVRGKGKLAVLAAPLNILRSVLQAKSVIKKVQPSLVVGLGGFVAGPGGAAARLSGVPLLIHEQNAVAGTTNKILSKLANGVLTAFPSVFATGVCIGNPVRTEFFDSKTPKASDECLRLLIVGGSRGARAINQLIPKMLAGLAEKKSNVKVWHQCGDTLFAETQQYYRDEGIEVSAASSAELVPGATRVVPFIDDMAAAYHWADLVVCRAGALTISELAAAGVASILIPFPHAIDDHQTRNAEFLSAEGAALVWQQHSLSAEKLGELVTEFINAPERVVAMGNKARQCARPDAVKQFADWCERLLTPAVSLG